LRRAGAGKRVKRSRYFNIALEHKKAFFWQSRGGGNELKLREGTFHQKNRRLQENKEVRIVSETLKGTVKIGRNHAQKVPWINSHNLEERREKERESLRGSRLKTLIGGT